MSFFIFYTVHSKVIFAPYGVKIDSWGVKKLRCHNSLWALIVHKEIQSVSVVLKFHGGKKKKNYLTRFPRENL